MKSPFNKKPNIILVDDHLIFRQGLKSLITYENIGNIVGEASDGSEFIEQLAFTRPDLVLMDIEMPKMNGFEATKNALAKQPNLKVIAFTMFDDEEYFRKMVEIGVKGYILKSTGINQVEQAITDVMSGKTYFSNVHPKNAEKNKSQKPKEEPQKPQSWWW